MTDFSRNISAEQPPATVEDDLTAYLVRMFEQISIALSQNAQIPVIHALPDKPQDGKIYYFGSIIGATIPSKGFWGYEEGVWAKL